MNRGREVRHVTQKKGFTLIELLVVIAIIAILSAIGLVALNGAREKARDAQRKSDIGQIRTALSLYYDDNNFQYPAQTAATPATMADCIDNTGAGATALYVADDVPTYAAGALLNPLLATGLVVPEYLGGQLEPPTGGDATENHYCYDTNEAYSSARSSYKIFTRLEAGSQPWYMLDDSGNSYEAAQTVPAGATEPVTCTGQAECPLP